MRFCEYVWVVMNSYTEEMKGKTNMLTLDKFEEASEKVKEVTLETKLIYSDFLSDQTGNKVYLKPENMQFTGAYKVRGAYYKISTLTDEERAKGLITASAGNHAQGVAYAAKCYGCKAVIVMPTTTPLIKVNRTKSYGAEVVLYGDVYDEACAKAYELAEKEGYTFIHPFDDEDVIAGQGTIGLELLEQLPEVEAVIIPIGGGGLISGVAYAIKNLNPNIRVYGVQAKGAPSMLNSIEHGKIERLEGVRTIADGIAVKEPGIHTFDLCQQYVDEIVSVTDDEISTAILALIEQHKLIAEGAGAVAVAAAMFNKVPIKGKKVICLISGGNIDVNILSRVIGRGLQKSGRSCSMTIELVDKPGQLQHVSEIIASTGANVVSVYHERVSHTADINGCYLRLEMETRNQQQINEIRQLLTVSGYKIVEG